MPCRDLADCTDWIQNAGSRLTVNHADMADTRIFREGPVKAIWVDRYILGRLLCLKCPLVGQADVCHPAAVGTIDQQQYLALTWDESGQHGLDNECAAALEGHTHMVVIAVDDSHQVVADPGVYFDKIDVPGAIVMQHGPLDSARGRQWPRRQQPGIAIR